MAQADAPLPDYPAATAGNATITHRGDVYLPDDGGAGVGQPDEPADTQADTGKDWELGGLTIRALEIGITVLLTTLFTQFSPSGLNHLNQSLYQLHNTPTDSQGRTP